MYLICGKILIRPASNFEVYAIHLVKIIHKSNSRMPRHSCCEMRVMQCMTYFFCASLQVYTPFRSAQNHCPPDNVRPAGGYIRWEIDSPTDTDLLLATYRGGSHLTSDIYINTKCCILPQIFELILSDWNKQNTGNVNRYKL